MIFDSLRKFHHDIARIIHRHGQDQRQLIGSLGQSLTDSIDNHKDDHQDWQLATCIALAFLTCLVIIAISLLIGYRCQKAKEQKLNSEISLADDMEELVRKKKVLDNRDIVLTQLV